MKSYEYQILRYIPDQVSGEFLNIGLVMYCKPDKILDYEFIDSRQRLTSTFQGIETTHIMQRVKSIKSLLDKLKSEKEDAIPLQEKTSVKQYTNYVLNKDDSALQFSDIKKGIDISVESAFSDLKDRLIFKWIKDTKHYRSDEDVWRNRYKKYFEKAGISDKLVSRTVKTKSDKIQFDQSYKNGKWNYFQPLNLDLKKKDSIKNKVYKWKGIISEMQTADEEMQIIFLPEMPKKKNGISTFIKEQLDSTKEDKVFSKLTTPESIGSLLRELKYQ
jgi:hypothetical protein